MRFDVLGPLRADPHGVIDDSDPATATPGAGSEPDITGVPPQLPSGRLPRTLLALLLARTDQPVSVETLTANLWPADALDPTDKRVIGKLHVLVHRVRQSLDDPDRITLGPQGYRLQVADNEVDATVFTALAGRVLRTDSDDDAVLTLGRQALALWRGEPFDELDAPALAGPVHRWRQLQLAVTVRVLEAEIALGRHDAAGPEIEAVAARNPLHERLQALAMTAQYRSGRQSEALETYRRTRDRLVDELGIEPGAELVELHQQILAGALPTTVRRPVPAQLPAGTKLLTGREHDLHRLSEVLIGPGPGDEPTGRPRICLVTGTAGVGKTALAVTWAHRRLSDFPDGQLFFDLRGFSPDEPALSGEVLAAFIRGLGGDNADVGTSLDERAAAYRSLVHGRRLLILLDNARSAEQVRPLLPAGGRSAVLITSREAMTGLAARDGAELIDLDRLGFDDAEALLTSLAGRQDDAVATATLLSRCSYLPLAVRIAAEMLRSRPQLDIATLVSEFGDGERAEHLDPLDTGDDPSTDVRSVFSWSYAALPESPARLFRLFGLLPGRAADVPALAALAGRDRRSVQRDLAALTRAHLVDTMHSGCFGQHDLLRVYAAELAEDTDGPAQRAAARSRLLAYFSLAVGRAVAAARLTDPRSERPDESGAVFDDVRSVVPDFDDATTAIGWLSRERPSIVAAVRASEPADARRVIEISQQLNIFLMMRGHGTDGMRIHRAAVEAARTLQDGPAEAIAELALGAGHSRFGDGIAGADLHYQRALDLSRAHGFRSGEARALNNLSGLRYVYGERSDAISLLTEALDVVADQPDQTARIVIGSNIGHYLVELNDFERADGFLAEALAAARQTDQAQYIAYILASMSDLRRRTGRTESALELARQALVIARDTGQRVREGEAEVVIAAALRDLSRPTNALPHNERALDLGRRCRDMPLVVEALIGLGRSHRLLDPNVAADLFVEAVELADEHRLHALAAEARTVLADTHAQLGDAEKAQQIRDSVPHEPDEKLQVAAKAVGIPLPRTRPSVDPAARPVRSPGE